MGVKFWLQNLHAQFTERSVPVIFSSMGFTRCFSKSALIVPISSYSHIIQLQFAAHEPLVKKYYSKQSRCPMIQAHLFDWES
jgi:hypothetical protein